MRDSQNIPSFLLKNCKQICILLIYAIYLRYHSYSINGINRIVIVNKITNNL
jgi:hypothetical protein